MAFFLFLYRKGNIMKKTLITLATAALVLSGCGSSTKDDNTFTVGMEAAYQPFNWQTSKKTDTAVKLDGGAGYADGYPRTLSNKGWVLIHGQKAPILGRVCMDQFMVNVSDIPDVKAGDEVTLIGKDGDEFISIETFGDMSGRFSYEFACDISKRVPRVYLKNGKEWGELTFFE